MRRVLVTVILTTVVCGVTAPLAGGPPPAAGTDLLVSGIFTAVKRYDATTGAFEGNTTCTGSPAGDMALGPDGKLYVGRGNLPQILRCDPLTGQVLGVFATTGPTFLYRPSAPMAICTWPSQAAATARGTPHPARCCASTAQPAPSSTRLFRRVCSFLASHSLRRHGTSSSDPMARSS